MESTRAFQRNGSLAVLAAEADSSGGRAPKFRREETMRHTAILALGAILFLCLGQQGADATGQVAKLRELMTPEQFRRAGLVKLTPSELSALEQWLGVYTSTVTRFVRPNGDQSQTATPDRTPRSAPRSPDVIESCIDGDFEGWEGETIFKLCNGQIWQQSEYAYTYEYAYQPDVVIYKTSTGYRMKVEDVEDTIGVTRIK